MTLQEIDEAEAKIRKQREDLAKERKKFTQACLTLGKEREELQQEKAEFEESKRTFRLDKVVDFLSFSPIKETTRSRDVSPSPPAPARGRASAPSPTPAIGTNARKRVATSPLPFFSTLNDGRSVRAKTKTTVIEVPDDDDEEFEHSVPEQGRVQEQWRHNQDAVAVSDEDEEEQLVRTNSNAYRQVRKESLPTFGVPGMPKSTFGSTVAAAARAGRPESQTTTTSVVATADRSSLKPTTTLGSSTPGRSGPSSTFTTSTPTPFVISFSDPSLSTQTPRPQTPATPATSSTASSSTLAAAAKSQPFNFTATIPLNTTFKSLSSRPAAATTPTSVPTAVPTITFNPRLNNNSRPSTITPSSSSSVPSVATRVQTPPPISSLNASVRMPSALSKAAAHLASRKTGITPAAAQPTSSSAGDGDSFSSSIFSRRPKA